MYFPQKVIWKRFYKKASLMDKGTLYQLKNTINCTSVPSYQADNIKAVEDFLLVVMHAHIIAACEAVLKERSINSVSELAKFVVAAFTMLQKGNTVSKTSDGVFVYICM